MKFDIQQVVLEISIEHNFKIEKFSQNYLQKNIVWIEHKYLLARLK